MKKRPAKRNPKCRRCGIRHRTTVSKEFCRAKGRFEKALCPWSEKGSTENIWSNERLRTRYHVMLWPWIVMEINRRDGGECQDCGATEGWYRNGKPFKGEELYTADFVRREGVNWLDIECHHVIPKGLGGMEHPANLKMVCQKCHQKYGKHFNKRIRRHKRGEGLEDQTKLEES